MPISSSSFDPGPVIEHILAGTIWSPRFPLRRAERLARISPKDDPVPRRSGLYRIHLEGEPSALAYVGQTSALRRRLNELSVGVYSDDMPFTTPHVAAPSLWAWTMTEPYAPLTLSFAEVEANAFWRQGLEDLVIALERWQRRKQPVQIKPLKTVLYSPLANYGKTVPGWEPSSSRAIGERGGPTLVEGPWHAPSIAPIGDLDDQQDAFTDNWGGHAWSVWRPAGEVPIHLEQKGLYRLWKRDSPHLWYMGCGQIAAAARDAARNNPDFLFSAVVGAWTRSEQEELRTDLLGLYIRQRKRPPLAQYGGEENATAGSAWPDMIQQGDDDRRTARGA